MKFKLVPAKFLRSDCVLFLFRFSVPFSATFTRSSQRL
ncbi:unnamed protein product [Soboliphyme baturini]|uniref:Uncharacterized protein n=1 Tax=Soboliphyme baturini TaxID=241478 RepID=A0A183J5K0_9BILA|nr:unnamed protein product [Soboliphyme baturini]